MQIITNDLRGPAKNTCYLRKGVAGEENAFHPIQGRASLPLLVNFLKLIFYWTEIFAPNLFISLIKSGYDTATDSWSVTTQLPTYIPDIQNAMNNL